MALTRFFKIHKIIQISDFSISSWLLLGATAQCFLTLLFPRNIAVLPSILLLLYRLIVTFLASNGYIHNARSNDILHGRYTTQVPDEDGKLTAPSSSSFVILVLSAHFANPTGRFTQTGGQLGPLFYAMWRDAEANREEYGYLGNTPPMAAEIDHRGPHNRRNQGKTLTWLSYWKSLDGLHGFAHAEAHRAGMKWWNGENEGGKKDPYVGVMHETYVVEKGGWENISHNFPPFAFGNARFPVNSGGSEKGGDDKKEATKWVSGLMAAKGKDWKNMESRMGRPPGSVGLKVKTEN